MESLWLLTGTWVHRGNPVTCHAEHKGQITKALDLPAQHTGSYTKSLFFPAAVYSMCNLGDGPCESCNFLSFLSVPRLYLKRCELMSLHFR